MVDRNQEVQRGLTGPKHIHHVSLFRRAGPCRSTCIYSLQARLPCLTVLENAKCVVFTASHLLVFHSLAGRDLERNASGEDLEVFTRPTALCCPARLCESSIDVLDETPPLGVFYVLGMYQA